MPHRTVHIPGDGEIEDRRSTTTIEGRIKWVLGILIPLGIAIVVGMLSHEHRLTGVESGVSNLADKQQENKKDTNERLDRIEKNQQRNHDDLLKAIYDKNRR